MRKKAAIVIMMVLAVNMLWGCGKKTVDYGLDGDTEQPAVERDDVDVTNNLAEMKVVEHWTDEWKFNSPLYADERLTVDTMKIDADVIMPDIEQFPLIEAEEIELDALFRKQFMNTYFGNVEIREHEEKQYTKDEIKEIIERFEEGAESNDPDVREMYEGFIREFEELLETAPDEAVAAEDYMNSNIYSGEMADGLICTVEFREAEYGRFVFAGPDRENDIFCPKSIREYDSCELSGDTETAGDMMNECRYTMAEAKRMADAFLIRIGLNNQICVEVVEPLWCGKNLDAQGNIAEYEMVPYGYKFTYSTGTDGIVMNRSTDTNYGCDGGNFDWQVSGDRTKIMVTDEGVVDVVVQDPITVHKVAYADELFPLDEIKKIMKKEALENTDEYSFVRQGDYSTPRSDEMKLFYMKVDNAQQEGVFCFRPLWCLSDGRQNHPIFVDAVTGDVTCPFKAGEALNGIIYGTDIE